MTSSWTSARDTVVGNADLGVMLLWSEVISMAVEFLLGITKIYEVTARFIWREALTHAPQQNPPYVVGQWDSLGFIH